ncbi:MAG: hypothetical protein U0835_18435 [Isosphaeraceae bacterium]
MATIYELRTLPGQTILAVPYRSGRRGKPVRLPDGAIVEAPLPDQLCEAPASHAAPLPMGPCGVPASLHHIALGLVKGFQPSSGTFLLPTGEVAAVYGAHVTPLGTGSEVAS